MAYPKNIRQAGDGMATYTSDPANALATSEDIKQLRDYLFQNNELLKYMFGNLDPEENYSASALQKYIERDERIATLEFTADGLKVSIKDLAEETEAHFEVLDDEISLKVDIGDVSNQLSIETDGITITGKRLKISTTNLTLTTDGTLVCKNGQFSGTVKSTTISSSSISGGSISIGDVFYVDEDIIELGDFLVSTDETYRFMSSNGEIEFYTSDSPDGNGFAGLKVSNVWIYGSNVWAAEVECDRVMANTSDKLISHFYDIELGKSWWNGWTITQAVNKMWNMIFRLARIVDNQWSDYSGVEDELDDWDSNHDDPDDW